MVNIIRYTVRPALPQVIANQEITVYSRTTNYTFDTDYFTNIDGNITLRADNDAQSYIEGNVARRFAGGKLYNPTLDLDNPDTYAVVNLATAQALIAKLRQELVTISYFRGYVTNPSELENIDSPTINDYAYVAQTNEGTTLNKIFNYTQEAQEDEPSWKNTGADVPNKIIEPYGNTPLAPTESGSAGNSDQYSRGDHSHPNDATKLDKRNDTSSVYGNDVSGNPTMYALDDLLPEVLRL